MTVSWFVLCLRVAEGLWLPVRFTIYSILETLLSAFCIIRSLTTQNWITRCPGRNSIAECGLLKVRFAEIVKDTEKETRCRFDINIYRIDFINASYK